MSSKRQFINTDTSEITAKLIADYESIAGKTVNPADPERLLILWGANAIVQVAAQINHAANQNIPSGADGENLDALAELYFNKARPGAKAAVCTVRFHISEAQASAVLVPSGTRVTVNTDSELYWETTGDAYISAGETYIDLQVTCMTLGVAGNGYLPGQISKVVDVFPYCGGCENLTTSDGGSDTATDEEYYQLLRESQDAFSVAGPVGAYVYWAKTVSTDIADVKATSPKPGYVYIYVLMDDGEKASDTIKEQVLKACNDAETRPLTDYVSVEDPEEAQYNIEFTYYILRGTSQSGAEIAEAVQSAVDEYISWQSKKLGRDIVPSQLIYLLKQIEGIKRIDVREPAFTVLNDGSKVDGAYTVPQIAKVGTVTIVNGGEEDD